ARVARRFEAVVVTRAGHAGVLVRTLRPAIAAVGAVGEVVVLTAPCAIAGVGGVALATGSAAARRARRLEAVVVTRTGQAGVLVRIGSAACRGVGAVWEVVGLADRRDVAGVG